MRKLRHRESTKLSQVPTATCIRAKKWIWGFDSLTVTSAS